MNELADLVTDDGRIDARLVARGNEQNLCDNGKISVAECAAMRRTMHDVGTYAAVAETHDVAHGTAHHHVTGSCSHAVDVEPTETSKAQVDLETCTAIRKAARGESYAAAAREVDVSVSTARRHARGECSHDNDTRRVL